MDRPEKPPLVSVIVPARNEEQNIADCLHSLLEQGSGIEIAMEIAREIIVADDGSEDKTATIVTQIAARLGRPRRGDCEHPHVSALHGNVGRLDEKLIFALPWRFQRRMANGGGIAGPLTAAASRYRMRNRPVVVQTPREY